MDAAEKGRHGRMAPGEAERSLFVVEAKLFSSAAMEMKRVAEDKVLAVLKMKNSLYKSC